MVWQLRRTCEAAQLGQAAALAPANCKHFAVLEGRSNGCKLIGSGYGYRQPHSGWRCAWDKRLGVLDVGYRQRSSSDLVEVA